MKPLDMFLALMTLVLATTVAFREVDYQKKAQSLLPELVVSVSGEVHSPGVIAVPALARTIHALERCGGATKNADLDRLDLAHLLVDGDHIVVPGKVAPLIEEGQPVPSGTNRNATPDRLESSSGHHSFKSHLGPSKAGGQDPQIRKKSSSKAAPPHDFHGVVDLNQANLDDLQTLPRVGPVLAQRILDARKASPGGSFGSLEELQSIRGIKGKTFERLKPHLKIEGL